MVLPAPLAPTIAVTLPAVFPRVRLLGRFRTLQRAQLLARLLISISDAGRDPSTLPDDFFLRVAAVFGQRATDRSLVDSIARSQSNLLGDFP